MKKLIAILVVFAMLVPAVFVLDISAWEAAKSTLLQGNSDADDPWVGFGDVYWGVTFGTENEAGNAGAKFSLEHDGSDDNWFYAWWKPADWIYLKMGKIGEDGNHDELMRKNGYYAKMYRAQAKWYR
jgi:hypothetical protein